MEECCCDQHAGESNRYRKSVYALREVNVCIMGSQCISITEGNGVCVYIYIYVCVCVYIYICVCVYIYIYMCVCVIYIYMCVCIYMYI